MGAAEGIAFIQQISIIAQVQRGQLSGPALGEVFAQGEIEGGMQGQVIGAVTGEESGAIKNTGGDP